MMMHRILTRVRTFLNDPTEGVRIIDFLLASFPKSGNTYTRFVFANIISGLYFDFKEINFYNLGEVMPELGKDDLKRTWQYTKVPRVIKTHKKYQNSFSKTKNYILIVRDPRDTMLSYYNYQRAKKGVEYEKDLMSFIKDENYGLPSLNAYIQSWFSITPHIFRYEDLLNNSQTVFSKFFNDNNIEIPSEILDEAIVKSSPEYVKKIELAQGRPGMDQNFKKGYKFIRNASLNQWKDHLDEDHLAYFKHHSSDIFSRIGYQL